MRKTLTFLIAAVAISTAVTFSRVWRYGFVNCDDYNYALNRHVRQGLCLPSAEWAVQDVSHGIWMPATWLSFMADYTLHRGSPQGMHIHNVLLHSVNACLLFYLLLMAFQGARGSSVPCALAALLWSVHPLRCESVAWIASRKDVLSMFWELLALVFWAKIQENRGEAWMVGDRRFDREGGRKAGVHTLGAAYGYGSEAELARSIRDVVSHWPNDIMIYPGHDSGCTMKKVRIYNQEYLALAEGRERQA